MWKWEANPGWHIFPRVKDQLLILMMPSVWKVSDVVGAGQPLGGRGPPNYGIIPKWELSPNYPAFGIIPELSSDRRQGASDRIGSLSWHLHYPLILNHYLLILVWMALKLNICWLTLQLKFRHKHLKLCFSGIVWTKMVFWHFANALEQSDFLWDWGTKRERWHVSIAAIKPGTSCLFLL